jgi:hypothetical protein
LGFERRFDAAIYRSASKAEVGTQSSEHGVVATSKHVDLSGCLFVERHVRLLGAPEAVKQHGKLAGYCNDGLTLNLLAASRREVEAPLSKRRVSSVRSQDVVGALYQQTSQVCVAGMGDAELRIVIRSKVSEEVRLRNPHWVPVLCRVVKQRYVASAA